VGEEESPTRAAGIRSTPRTRNQPAAEAEEDEDEEVAVGSKVSKRRKGVIADSDEDD
jgi:hypothetical protein